MIRAKCQPGGVIHRARERTNKRFRCTVLFPPAIRIGIGRIEIAVRPKSGPERKRIVRHEVSHKSAGIAVVPQDVRVGSKKIPHVQIDIGGGAGQSPDTLRPGIGTSEIRASTDYRTPMAMRVEAQAPLSSADMDARDRGRH